MNENLIGVPELAERLGVSASLIYKLVEAKQIPHYRIASAIRFDPADIDAWLAKSGSRSATCPTCG